MADGFSVNIAYAKTERRARIEFNFALAVGAFSTSLYTVACPGGEATPPTVVAVHTVLGQPGTVELVLSADLAANVYYTVTASSTVPSLEHGTLGANVTSRFCHSVKKSAPALEQSPSGAIELWLYGADLTWDGVDIVETPNGDLATVSGLQNATIAQERKLMSEGLPWNAAYGGKLRKFVDGSRHVLSQSVGSIVEQCLRDDRVKEASAEVRLEEVGLENTAFIDVSLVFVGNLTSELSVPVSV